MVRSGAGRWFGPERVHLASLAVAAVCLVWPARHMTLAYDDWSFFVPLERGDRSASWFLAPHNEHLVLLPKLVYAALESVFGFGSVAPFLAVTLVLHLVLCHLLRRVMTGAGADPWLATAAAAGFALYAAGVENILWAFQMALVGSLVLGMLMLSELARTRPRPALVAVLGLASVATSGLGIVVLALGALVCGPRRLMGAGLALLPGILGFGLWFLTVGRSPTSDLSPTSPAVLPLYVAVGLGNGIASLVPFRSAEQVVWQPLNPVSGFAAVIAVLLSLLALGVAGRVGALRASGMAGVLALGAPVFWLLTSLSRSSFGLAGAMASRYTYVTTAFLLPLVVVLVSRLVSRGPRGRQVARGVATVLALANALSWGWVAPAWVDKAAFSTRVVAAGQDLVRAGQPTYDTAFGTAELTDFSRADLEELTVPVDRGSLQEADRATAALRLQVRLVPVTPTGPAACQASARQVEVPLQPAGGYVVLGERGAREQLVAGGLRSPGRATVIEGGAYAVEGLVAGTVVFTSVDGTASLRSCRR